MKNHFLKTIIILGAFLAFGNWLFLKLGWYYAYDYADVFMHGSWGLWSGLFVSWFLFESGYIPLKLKNFFNTRILSNLYTQIIATFLIVLIIGVAWEIFELMIGATPGLYSYYLSDTISDILMDVGGGVSAFVLYETLVNKQTRHL